MINLIDKKDEALYCIEKSLNNFSILDICNRAIYDHLDDKHPLLGMSILEILQYLYDNHAVESVEPQLSINIDKSHPLNYKPELQKLSESFIVLWNFWHNATNRNASQTFSVNVWSTNDFLFVTFTNKFISSLHDQAIKAIHYLRSEYGEPPKIGGGLHMSKKIMIDKLGWSIMPIETKVEKNTFEVTIKLR